MVTRLYFGAIKQFLRQRKIAQRILIRRFTSEINTDTNNVVQHIENLARLRESFNEDESNDFVVPLFKRSLLFAEQIAIKDSQGEFTYFQIFMSAKRIAIQISNICGGAASSNVCLLCANNILLTVAQWACWISGQVAMPIDTNFDSEVLKEIMIEANVKLIIATYEYETFAKTLARQHDLALMVVSHAFLPPEDIIEQNMPGLLLSANDKVMIEGSLTNDFYTISNALLLYDSAEYGICNKPQGVMLSHKNLDAQMKSLVEAWQINASDTLLNTLPVEYGFSCLNAVLCPLSVGGKVVMHEKFNNHNVWSTLLGINAPIKERVSVFIGVPAIYGSLISEYEKIFAKNSLIVEYIESFCKKNIRLMASGNGPLREEFYNRWREMTGHNILECYGLPETGIVMSNPYFEDDESDTTFLKRCQGTIGLPLPGVKVRLVDDNDKILFNAEGRAGEGYWLKDSEENEECEENEVECESETKSECSTEDVNDGDGAAASELQDGAIVGELQIAGMNVFDKYYIGNKQLDKKIERVHSADNAEDDEEETETYFKTGYIVKYDEGVFRIIKTKRMKDDLDGKAAKTREIEQMLKLQQDIKVENDAEEKAAAEKNKTLDKEQEEKAKIEEVMKIEPIKCEQILEAIEQTEKSIKIEEPKKSTVISLESQQKDKSVEVLKQTIKTNIENSVESNVTLNIPKEHGTPVEPKQKE